MEPIHRVRPDPHMAVFLMFEFEQDKKSLASRLFSNKGGKKAERLNQAAVRVVRRRQEVERAVWNMGI